MLKTWALDEDYSLIIKWIFVLISVGMPQLSSPFTNVVQHFSDWLTDQTMKDNVIDFLYLKYEKWKMLNGRSDFERGTMYCRMGRHLAL